jgi:aspartyl protease family protein
MREAVFLTLAVATFVGFVFAPDGADEPENAAISQAEAERVPGGTGSDPARYAAWAAGSIDLARAADGHFYAETTVNSAPVRLLVDTGASVVALTAADARAAGLTWSAAEIEIVAQGASGPVAGVPVTLDRVVLGGHEARDVRAIIVPEGLAISLLGQSFLATIDPVRIERDRMVLGG